LNERDALGERLAAEQDERRRLAELIHDGPVQHLAAIAQMLGAAEHALGADDPDAARQILARASTVARDANADRLRARRDVRLDVDVDAGDMLGEGAQAGLYQIVREALDQAVRRGPPTRISVQLRHTPAGGAELVVSDDGSGERRQAVLDGLAERASTLNAELFVDQERGGGTQIRVIVPPSAAQR
jgi:signal transduction histidine kinase